MSDETLINDGGEGGGEPLTKLTLKRSELIILRRIADKYPIQPGERQEVVDNVMDLLRTSKSRRTKIAAARTIAALERVNHDEMKLYLECQKSASADLQPASVTINNQVVVQAVTVESVLNEYADVIQEGAIPPGPATLNGVGEQVHTPKANGKAS